MLVTVVGVGGGCSSVKKPQFLLKPQYQPSNFFALEDHIPSPIRRVAILPITANADDWEGTIGATELQGTLRSELGKAKMFELVVVTESQLRGLTGRRSWRADEELPEGLFDQIRELVDCDAVLFAHLTAFRPYRPLVTGWNMKLVESSQQYILWSIDEVFDSSEEMVGTSAEIYDREHFQADYKSVERSGIMISPRRFARYTLDAVFQTLPGRKKP